MNYYQNIKLSAMAVAGVVEHEYRLREACYQR